MVIGWKNAPWWMKLGCIVISWDVGLVLSKLLYNEVNYLFTIIVFVILFLLFKQIDATVWKFKGPSWRISYQTELRYIDNYYDKHNWHELGLTPNQSAWLFLMCLIKDKRDSYCVIINNRKYWIWGQQTKTVSFYYNIRRSTKTFETLPSEMRVNQSFGGRQFKPKNCQYYKMPNITDERIIRFGNLYYDGMIHKLDDIYNMMALQNYKIIKKLKSKETILRTY